MALPGVLAIETAGLKAWPGLEVAWDGGWIRRAANGYTKRANSVQCLDPGDDTDAEDRLAAAARWFEARGLRPVFRQTPLTAPGVLAALDALGWNPHDRSHLLAMELGPQKADPRALVVPVDDPQFLAAQQRLQGYDETTVAKLRAVCGAMTVPARGIVLHNADGEAVASGLMAVADGIAVTGNVITSRTERRRGHAAAMMRTGLAWARAEGARVAALNVLAGNDPAIALYEGLGYRRQYDYVYRLAAFG